MLPYFFGSYGPVKVYSTLKITYFIDTARNRTHNAGIEYESIATVDAMIPLLQLLYITTYTFYQWMEKKFHSTDIPL